MVVIFECNQIFQRNLQDMLPESSSVKLLQFQRYRIFPRDYFLARPVDVIWLQWTAPYDRINAHLYSAIPPPRVASEAKIENFTLIIAVSY